MSQKKLKLINKKFFIIHMIILTLSILFFLLYSQSYSLASSYRLTPEIEIGRRVFIQIEPHLVFSKNPLVKQYVERIGKRILENLPSNPFEFRFFPIIASEVNAFALPNGYIFITNRLIQACDTEDELAFVLCHEMAHVLRRHFMNFLSQKKKIDMTTLAIIVLGSIIAQDQDLQEGLPALSIGMNQNLALSYSREQEYEADTYGLRYLKEAGYDSEGASNFMNKIRLLSQITISMPVYLSTHPMPIDRLINIKGFHESFTQKSPKFFLTNLSRLKLWCRLETELAVRLLADFNPRYLNNPNDIDTLYGLALIYEKLGSSEEAEKYYQKGLTLVPKDQDLLRDYAIFLFRRDRIKDSEEQLKSAIAINPDDPMAHHYLGRIMMDQKQFDEAIKEFNESKHISPDFPDNYHFLGILYSKQGDEENSHKSFERYFSIIGDQQAAQIHAKKGKQTENITK